MLIPALPGVRIDISEAETNYCIVDHLGSVRVATTQSVEYVPYGGIVGDHSPMSRSYTGKQFNDRVVTYDFLARQYDASLGRFLGRDAIAGMGSPYPYVNADPIDKLDPDGNWPLYFFMYSRLGTLVPDHRNPPNRYPGLLEDTHAIVKAARETPVPVLVSELEGTKRITLPAGAEMKHLTLSMHGTPGRIYMIHPQDGRKIRLPGERFSSYLSHQLRKQFGEDSIRTLESIGLYTCFGSCPTVGPDGQPGPSFVDEFVAGASQHFPNLSHVIASPYEVGFAPPLTGPSRAQGIGPIDYSTIRFSTHLHTGAGTEKPYRDIGADRFFTGDMPIRLYDSRIRSRIFSPNPPKG